MFSICPINPLSVIFCSALFPRRLTSKDFTHTAPVTSGFLLVWASGRNQEVIRGCRESEEEVCSPQIWQWCFPPAQHTSFNYGTSFCPLGPHTRGGDQWLSALLVLVLHLLLFSKPALSLSMAPPLELSSITPFECVISFPWDDDWCPVPPSLLL